jgi:hypothetical protein
MPPPQEPWHLKREIQLGHVITTVTVALSAIFYVSKLDQRIALVEQQLVNQHQRDNRQDEAVSDKTIALTRSLERMEAKLDRLIERNNGKP